MRTLKQMTEELESLPIETAIYALKRGEKFFRAARSCRRGHLPIRYTNGGGCVDCVKEAYTGEFTEKKELPSKKLTEEIPNIKYKGKLITRTLDKIKTGLVYVVLGRCESGST